MTSTLLGGLGMISLLPLPSHAQTPTASAATERAFPPGEAEDYHGYVCHNFQVAQRGVKLVEPKAALPGRPWVWCTMFWGGIPKMDAELLKRGFHVGYIDVGNTFGSPDALKQFDAFYAAMTGQYGLSKRPALEGISRGGLSAYRWASENPDKVGCIYGDAPVCDMKSWPGAMGRANRDKADWALAIRAYHFTSEQQMLDYPGNPVDTLAPIAAAHVPIIHVIGDADTAVPPGENTDVVRERYLRLGGEFVEIIKRGCDHHPHGLTDPTPLVNFIVAHGAEGEAAQAAAKVALPASTVVTLPTGQW